MALRKVFRRHGIQFSVCSAYAHFRNGVAERLNEYLKEQLLVLKQTVGDNNWPRYLAIISLNYNSIWNRRINESPYYLVYSREPKSEQDEGLSNELQLSTSAHKGLEETIAKSQ